MVNAPLIAIFQSVVPHDIQGRVFTIIGSIATAVTPLGLAAAGPLADAIGIRPLFFIAGIGTFISGIACLFIPAVMNLEKSKPGESSQSTIES